MEKIKLLREKQKLPSASDLKNKLQENLVFMKNNEGKIEHKLAGKNHKLLETCHVFGSFNLQSHDEHLNLKFF